MPDIKCLIIEDEPLAVKVLSGYIGQVSFLTLQHTCRDAMAAMDYLHSNTIDLIFLDIHLPGLKGMDFLKTLQHPPAVIITTAYQQYAVEGFELNVTDYLLKPFSFARFLSAVNKVNKTEAVNAKKDHLFVTVQKKKTKILFSTILYIESQREYVKIVTTTQAYTTKMPTHEIESLLPAGMFKRIHRSFIVAVDKITAYTADSIEINGLQIPVGRGYRDRMEGL